MQAAQDRDRGDATDGLNRPAHRCVLPQRQMCANVIVVGGVSSQDSPQVGLAEYDDVVKALTPDRADRSLNIGILPWRAARDGSVSDSHRSKSLRDDRTVARSRSRTR